jgi:serine/threonine-protein kinase
MIQHGLKVGDVVDAHWRLERPLHEGVSSCLWEAEHMRLGGRVAIKFLLDGQSDETRNKARFERDARALGQIRSPHIVQVLDQGVCQGLPYLVMELLEGEDLGRLLARERTLSLKETANLTDQLCRGLTSIHEAGFVHRDLQPRHVFVIHELDGGQFVKLLDFGIARIARERGTASTLTEAGVGAPHYWSPEQIEHPLQHDQRSDVWALAAIAYHMLLGRPPFAGEEPAEVCARIRAGELTPLHQLDGKLPTELDAFFRRAFQRKPGARFASVRALADALHDIARAHGAEVTRWVEAPFAPARQLRQKAAEPASTLRWVAVIASGLLLMAAAWSVWSARAERSSPRAAAPDGAPTRSAPADEPRAIVAPAAAAAATGPALKEQPRATSQPPAHSDRAARARRAPPPPPTAASEAAAKRGASASPERSAEPANAPKDWGF